MIKSKDNSHKRPSKYHYHLKSDQVYGDKKLKLCGQCILPVNLTKDLRFLERYMKRSDSNDQIDQIAKTTKSNSNPYLTSIKLPSHSDHGEFYDNDSSSSFKIDFNVLDLTMERQSGVNLPIIYLPSDLFRFKQLVRLHLDCNHIKSIPDLLGENLINLETLTLSNNHLQTLPDSLTNLKKLKSLHLSSNKFETFPEIVCQVASLRFLDLSGNNLAFVSPTIENLKNLESLLLFENKLTELPDTIGKMSRLKTLWLGNNKIAKLPRSITNLKNLDWNDENFNLSTNIEGNPLTEPPYDVCVLGMASITSHFQSLNAKKQTKKSNS